MKEAEPIVHRWEKWPFWFTYLPLSFVWLYYIVLSRSVWFFTPSNPAITFGGMQGETKEEMYARLPKHLYAKTLYIEPVTSFEKLLQEIQHAEIGYQRPANFGVLYFL